MDGIGELTAYATGAIMLICASGLLIWKKTLGASELVFAALGLVLVAGPTFLSSVKFNKEGFEIVSRIKYNSDAQIAELSKKIDLAFARIDAIVPEYLKPKNNSGTKTLNGKEWLDLLKSQPAEKTNDLCQNFPAFCLRKSDGFTLNDQKIIDFGNNYNSLNQANSRIQVLMNESADIKSTLQKKNSSEWQR